jgi:NAD(P)-dependent dehydrogenase (short-subunit alcohol dehydrogenase family)
MTVERHRSNILQALGLRDRTQLTRYAIRVGLVEPQGTGPVTDVRGTSDVDQPYADLQHELRGLDALVNNAGIAGPTAPIEELPFESWEASSPSIAGRFIITRRAIPLFKQVGGSVHRNHDVARGPLRLFQIASTPRRSGRWSGSARRWPWSSVPSESPPTLAGRQASCWRDSLAGPGRAADGAEVSYRASPENIGHTCGRRALRCAACRRP